MQKQEAKDIPFGYQPGDNGTLVINEPEATLIRKLFQHRIGGSAIRVFIYCRLAAEDDTRLTAQEKECRDYCESNGFLVVGVFKEFGSGITLDREELPKMRARYSEVDGIVVVSPNRLSRNYEQYRTLVQEMIEHNVELICVNATSEDPLIATILTELTAQERENTLLYTQNE